MNEAAGSITDPEVCELARHAAQLRREYVKDESDPWRDSPFGWMKARPSSKQVGAIGEKLVERWCVANDLKVRKSPDTVADRLIEGRRVEIKFSTLWLRGEYRFQQIRDQDYEYLFALGVSPFDAHAWVIPKSVLMRHVMGRMGQHTGADATDTSWLRVKVGEEPGWLTEWGGTLAKARDLLAAMNG